MGVIGRDIRGLVARRILLSCTSLFPVLGAGIVPAFAQAVNTGGMPTLIVPNGRTQTTVKTTGAQTDVTTETVRGRTGFNSFSRFETGAGSTVNLHLPNGTDTLVNAVRDAPVVIEGTVNSLKNGTIGGNVVFADPYGFVLGAKGVINTGGLTVTTPTREFLDRAIDARGNIDLDAIQKIENGDVPLSPNGSVVIRGRVNASSHIDINANDLNIVGSDKIRRHKKNFDATVNTAGGAGEGASLVVTNGRIRLVAAGDVSVGGKVHAKGGGQVTVKAGRNATVASSGRVSASSDAAKGVRGSVAIEAGNLVDLAGLVRVDGNATLTSTGGDIILRSTGKVDTSGRAKGAQGAKGAKGGDAIIVAKGGLIAEKGAAVLARGLGNADGGSVELSGHRSIDIANIKVDLRSEGIGKAGHLLIDPANIVIDNASTYVRGAVGSIIDNVGSVAILASDTVTITSTGRIDTRMAGSDALDVSVVARMISVEKGGSIRADAGAGQASGNVWLKASDSSDSLYETATTRAGIYIAGDVFGKDLVFSAKAISSSAGKNLDGANEEVGIGGIVSQKLGKALSKVVGGRVAADASATVEIASTANLVASGAIVLEASGQQTVTTSTNSGSGSVFPIAIGEANVTTAVDVRSGAKISAAGGLTLDAHNDLKLDLSAISTMAESEPASIAVAVGLVDSETRSVIESGAKLDIGGALTLSSRSVSSLSVVASANAPKDGKIGTGVAYSEADIRSIARLGADVGGGSHATDSVSVTAVADTLNNVTRASTEVGDGFALATGRRVVPEKVQQVAPTNILGMVFAETPVAGLLPDAIVKAGFALSLARYTQVADASIAATSAGAAAPTIVANGNVAVISSLYDAPIRNSATATVNSGKGDEQNDVGVSVGFVFGDYDHRSHATIGKDVAITAANLGLEATSDSPIFVKYGTERTAKDVLGAITSALNSNGGVVKNILTTYASSSSTAEKLGLAGSLNLLMIGHDTQAFIASGAKITTTDSGDQGWATGLTGADAIARGSSYLRQFANGVIVRASSSTESINIAGSPAWLLLFGGGNAGQSEPGKGAEGSSAGASLNLNLTAARTVAGIGAGVEITSAADLAVEARMRDSIVAIAPSSGKGAALGLSGLVSFLGIDNETKASISNTARIATRSVDVKANQDSLIIAVSGALSTGTGSNVGLAATWVNLLTDTAAFIGNNDAQVAGTDLANGLFGRGFIATDSLKVTADTGGAVYALSVAAAVSSPESGKPGIKQKITEKIDTGVNKLTGKGQAALTKASDGAGKIKTFFSDKASDLLGKIGSKATELNNDPAEGQSRKFSMAAAGSLSGVTTGFGTSATIDGAVIRRLAADGAVPVTVKASNDLLISTTSGAASLATAGKDSSNSSAAVAGALAIAFSNNQTTAVIRNSTITNAGAVSVRAIASGQQLILGLGVAINTNENNSVSLAGSISFGGVIDGVNALIETSTINGMGSGSNIDALAYQNTDIGIGGLAVAGGKGAGIGLALTGTVITDPVGGKAASARIVDTSISDADNLTVEAITVSRILSGAASAAISTNGVGLAGGVVFSDVSPTTLAEIVSVGTARQIAVSGNVKVASGSERRDDIELILAGTIRNKIINAGFDFTQIAFGADKPGAMTYGFAGAFGGGNTGAGGGILYAGIRHSHVARIANTKIDAGHDVLVRAVDTGAIVGTAAGGAVSTSGYVAIAGSIAVNLINARTAAEIVGDNTYIRAANVGVEARNSALTGGTAGVLAIATDSGAGLGLSIVNNTIQNKAESHISGATIEAANNVLVSANSASRLLTASASLGAGYQGGAAGSLSTSLALNDTIANVGDGARVTAQGSVAISAINSDDIKATAGSASGGTKVGVGLSSVINIVRGTTSASIDSGANGRTTSVNAFGIAGGVNSASGALNNAPAYSIVDIAKSLVLLSPDLSQGRTTLTGVDVLALSQQVVSASAFSAAITVNVDSVVSFSGAVSPIVNVMGGDVTATIGKAAVNTASGIGSSASARVLASSNTFNQNVVFSAAGASGGAGAAALVSNVLERKVAAEISDSSVGRAGAGSISVLARSTADSLNLVTGFGGGTVGGAASLAVNVIDAKTWASVAGGSVSGRGLLINADSSSRLFAVNGTMGAGGNAAAGAMNVTVNRGSTKALLGAAGRSTAVDVGDLTVLANSSDRELSAAIGGAFGSMSLAGMMNFSVVMSDTIAAIDSVRASASGNVRVEAGNRLDLDPIAGGIAVGGGTDGYGAAANIVLVKSLVSADLLSSTVSATGNVDVKANALREIDLQTATAGIGLSNGLAASLAIMVAGADLPSEATKEMGSTLGTVNNQLNASVASSVVDKNTLGYRDGSGDMKTDVVSSSLAAVRQDTIRARVADSTLTGAATAILADSQIATSNYTTGAGLAGSVGVGAALGFSVVKQSVIASASGALTFDTLTVKAQSRELAGRNAINVFSTGAGGGVAVAGIGAAVAYGRLESTTEANATGTLAGRHGTVNVEAADRLSVDAQANGGAGSGGVAIGASLTLAQKDAIINAVVGGSLANASGLQISAISEGALRAYSVGGAGGLYGAGTAAGAAATDAARLTAKIADNAVLSNIGVDGISISATATPQVRAEAIGAAISGTATVGASTAVAKNTSSVQARIGEGVTISTTGAVNLAALTLKGSQLSTFARAVAGTGGLYASLQATYTRAETDSTTEASVGDGTTIAVDNAAVTVKADSTVSQGSEAIGISLGLLAVGANVAESVSNTHVYARLGNNLRIAAGDLSVTAKGADENRSDAVSGSGGLVAGSAAVALTKATAETIARIGAGSDDRGIVLSGRLNLKADHQQTIAGKITSVNATAIGGSGAVADHSVSSTVLAEFANSARIQAANLDMAALNATQKRFEGEAAFSLRPGSARAGFAADDATANIASGSGGVLNGAGGKSTVTISHDTQARLGAGASVRLNSTAAQSGRIEAYNEIVVHDKARLDSGGLIATADTRTLLDVTKNDARIALGEGASLAAANGNLSLAAWDQADIDLRAISVAYGLAGVPSGAARADYRADSQVSLENNARVLANSRDDLSTGTISLLAGVALDRTPGKVRISTTVDLFNKTAVPINTTPDAYAGVARSASILLSAGSLVGAAGDVNLVASRSAIDARAVGTGKDIYRDAASDVASGLSNLFGGGNISLDYKGGSTNVTGLGTVAVDGTVLTGTQRQRSLIIEYAMSDVGTCKVRTTDCLAPNVSDISYTVLEKQIAGSSILDRVKELRRMLSDYGSDPVANGAFRAEITYLEAKLIALGYSRDGSSGQIDAPPPALLLQQELNDLNGKIAGMRTDWAKEQQALDVISAGIESKVADLNAKLVSIQSGLSTVIGNTNDLLKNSNQGISDWTLNVIEAKKQLRDTLVANLFNTYTLDKNAVLKRLSDKIDEANRLISEIQARKSDYASVLSDLGRKRQAYATAAAAGDDAQVSRLTGEINQLTGQLGGYATAQQVAFDKLNTIYSTDLLKIGTDMATLTSNARQAQAETLKQLGYRDGDRDFYMGGSALAKYTESLSFNFSPSAIITVNPNDSVSVLRGNIDVLGTTLSGADTSSLARNVAKVKVNYYALLRGEQRLVDLPGEIAGARDTRINAPEMNAIVVGDVIARMGDINITADRLIGTGTLSAPGDASISITNRTANNLTVGNLTIDTNAGGHIRFNDALVENLSDINALNPGKSGASFNTVTTAKSGGSAAPSITIRSEYDSGSLYYYDPSINPQYASATDANGDPLNIYDPAKALANKVYFRTRGFYSPDITLASGTKVSNGRGQVSILSASGNIYSNATIEAGGVSITAKNGDFVQSYTYGFSHVAGDPQFGTPSGLGIVANGAVSIAARYLNINGVVQSGMAERTVNISANPRVVVSAAQVGYDAGITTLIENPVTSVTYVYFDEFGKLLIPPRVVTTVDSGPGTAFQADGFQYRDLGNGVYYRLAKGSIAGQFELDSTKLAGRNLSGIFQVATADADTRTAIGVTLDTATGKLSVDPTNIRGGSIQLYGQIMNTGADAGKLRVLDGYGQIRINNESGREIAIARLDTGEDSGNGRGIRGVIDITDIREVGRSGAYPVIVRKTVYTRDLVNGEYKVVARVQDGELDNAGNFYSRASYTNSNGTDRQASYSPQDGLRYVTLTGEDSSTIVETRYKGVRLFNSAALEFAPDDVRVGDPTTIVRNRVVMSDAANVVVNTSLSGTPTVTSTTTYKTPMEPITKDKWNNCLWWTLCVFAEYGYTKQDISANKAITTTSRKADYGIGIDFIGSNTGLVDIRSGGSVTLNGAIDNRTGSVGISVANGNIAGNGGASRITAASLNLSASGSVGTIDNALSVTTNGGRIDASAGNGVVALSANSALTVGTITAAGDPTAGKGRVKIDASGSINATADSLIQAPRVELSSAGGAIGGVDGLLTVNTGYSDRAQDRPFGDPLQGAILNHYYGLKAVAAGDIGIQSKAWSGNQAGHMLVDEVRSAGGNVRLKAAGAILDNNPVEALDTRTYDELLHYWDKLGLMAGADNTAKTNEALANYERTAEDKKRSFDALSGGTAYNAAFAAAFTDTERANFALAYRKSNPAATDAEIAAALQARADAITGRYHALHAELAAFAGTFDAAGAYTASAAEITDMQKGATWTERELALSLSAGALKTITGTNPVLKAANVSGRAVTLDAGGTIGERGDTIVIDVGAAPRSLSDAQKVALLTAERSDFLSSGNDQIRIQSTRPVNFTASERLDVSTGGADGFAYLASRGDAHLGSVAVTGELRLKVLGSIDTVTGAADASAGSFVLEAANGAIGSAAAALRITAPETGAIGAFYPGSITARAAGAVNIAVGGDANIDTIFSRAGIAVHAGGSIRSASDNGLVNLIGSTIRLSAGQDIGAADRRVAVNTGIDGLLSLSAGGNVRIAVGDGQTARLGASVIGGLLDFQARRINIEDDVAAARLALTAASEIRIGTAGKLSGQGSLKAGYFLMEQTGLLSLDSGFLKIETSGNAVLGAISLKGATTGIEVIADGSILSAAPGSVISADTATSLVRLQALNAIGATTGGVGGTGGAIAIRNGLLVASAGGHISLHTLATLSSNSLIETTRGDISILSDQSVALASLRSSGTIAINASGAIDLASTDAATLKLKATGALALGTATVAGLADLSGASIKATSISAGSLAASAPGQIEIASAAVTGAANLIGGSAKLTAMSATTLIARTTGTLGLGTAIVTGLADLSGSSITADDVKAGVLTASTSGQIDIGSAVIAGSADLNGASAKVTTLSAASVNAKTTGALGIGTMTATGLADLSGGSIRATTVSAGSLSAASQGSLDLGKTIVTGHAGLSAKGDATVSDLSAASLDLATDSKADLAKAKLAGKASVMAGGTAVFGTLGADDATIRSAGDLTLASLTARIASLTSTAGTVSLTQGGTDSLLDMTGVSIKADDVKAGALNASAYGQIDIASAVVTGAADLSGGSAKATTLSAASLTAKTTGALGLGTATVTGLADLSGGSITATTVSAGSLTATSQASLDLGKTTVTGHAGLSAKGDATVNDLSAASLDLATDGKADLAKVAVAGKASVTAGGAALLGTLGADDATVHSAGDLTLASLTARTASLTSTAGAVSLTQGGTDGLLDVAGVSITADDLKAGALNASASGQIAIASAAVTGAADLSGGSAKVTTLSATTLIAKTTGTLGLGTATVTGLADLSGGSITADELKVGALTASTPGQIDIASAVVTGAADLSGGSARVTTLSANALNAKTTGTLDLGTATVTGLADLSGGSVAATTVSAGSLTAASQGSLDLGKVTVTGQAGLTAKGDTTVKDLSAAGLDLVTDGKADLAKVAVAGKASVMAGGAAVFGTLGAEDATIRSAGDLTVASLTAGIASLTSTAGAVSLTQAGTDGLLDMAGVSIRADDVKAGALNASASGRIDIASAVVTGGATLNGGSAQITALSASSFNAKTTDTLGLGTATVTGLADLSGGSIMADDVKAGALNASASGRIDLTSAAVTGAADLNGGSAKVTTLSAASVIAKTTGPLGIGTMTATGLADLSGGSIAADDVKAGVLNASASGQIDIASAVITGAASLNGGSVRATTLSAGTLTAVSQNSLDLGKTTVTGHAGLSSKGDATIEDLSAASLDLATDGKADLAKVAVAGKASVTAGGAALLGTLGADDATVHSVGDLTLASLTARTASLTSTAGAVSLTQGGTDGLLDVAGVSIRADDVKAGALNASASGQIDIASAVVTGAADLSGGSAKVTTLSATSMTAKTTGALGLGMATVSGLADLSGSSITADELKVGALTASTPGQIDIASAVVTGAAELSGGSAKVTTLSANSVTAKTTGTLGIGTATVTGLATLSGGSITADDLKAGALNASASGQIDIASAVVTGAADLDGGSAKVTTLSATTLIAKTTGTLGLGTATVTGLADLSGGSITADELKVGALTASTPGQIDIASAVVTGAADLSGGSARVTTLSANALNAKTTGALDIGMSTVTGLADLSGGSVTSTTVSAGSLTAVSQGSLDLGKVTVTGQAGLTAKGDATVKDLSAAGLDLVTDGKADLAKVAVAGKASVMAGGAAVLGTLGAEDATIRSAGDLTVASLTAGIASLTSTAGAVSLTQAGTDGLLDMAGSSIKADDVKAGALNASASGQIDIASAVVTGGATLNGGSVKTAAISAQRLAVVSDAIEIGRAAIADHLELGGGSVKVTTLSAASVTAKTTGMLDIDTATVTGFADLSGGSVMATTVSSGSLLAASQGILDFGKVTVTGHAGLSAKGDATVRDLSAASLDLATDGKADLAKVAVAGKASVAAGATALLGTLSADDATVRSTGDLTLASLAARTAGLTSTAGVVSLTHAGTDGLLDMAGLSLRADDVKAGALNATAAGPIDIASAVVTGAATLNGGSVNTVAISAQRLAVVSDAIEIGRAAIADHLELGGGSAKITTLSATSVSAKTTGILDLGTATITGLADLSGGSINAATVSAGSLMAASQGSLDLGKGTVAGRASLTAGGTAVLGALNADDTTVRLAGDLTLASLAAKTASLTSTAGNVSLTQATIDGLFDVAGASIRADNVAAGVLNAFASGQIDMASAVVHGAAKLNGGSVNTAAISAQRLAVVSDSIEIGQATIADHLELSGGSAKISTLSATSLTAKTTGAMTLGTATVTGHSNLSGGSVTAKTLSAGSLTTASQGGLDLGKAVVAGRANLSAKGDATVSDLSAASLGLSIGGTLVFDMLKTVGVEIDRGDMVLSAAGAIRGGAAEASGSLAVKAGKDLVHAGLRAGGDLLISIGGGISGASLEAQGLLQLELGAVPADLVAVRAKTLAVTSAEAVTIRTASIGERAAFGVRDLTVERLDHTGNGSLNLAVEGVAGGDAGNVAMTIESGGRVVMDRLYALDSQMRSSGSSVAVVDGHTLGSMRWETPATTIVLDNRSPQPMRDVGVQLYARGGYYSFSQEGVKIDTSATVMQTAPGLRVMSDTGPMSLTLRLGGLMTATTRMASGAIPHLPFPVVPAGGPIASVSTPLAGAAVNQDQEGDASPSPAGR